MTNQEDRGHVSVFVEEHVVLEITADEWSTRVSIAYRVVKSSIETRSILDMAKVANVSLDFSVIHKG